MVLHAALIIQLFGDRPVEAHRPGSQHLCTRSLGGPSGRVPRSAAAGGAVLEANGRLQEAQPQLDAFTGEYPEAPLQVLQALHTKYGSAAGPPAGPRSAAALRSASCLERASVAERVDGG